MRKIVFIIFTLMCAVMSAQTVKVEMDSTYVTYGCPMTFHLQAIVPEGEQILFPQEPLQHGGIIGTDDSLTVLLELDDQRVPTIDTIEHSAGMLTLQQDLTVFAFDSATLYIPPFRFVNQRGDTLLTNSLALKVFVPFENVEVDPQKFCDIKGVETPDLVIWDYADWFLWPLLAIVLIVGLWAGYRYWKEHKNQQVEVKPKEKPLPPHVEAMQRLEELNSKKLWQDGHNKEFHTELTEILRQYIERRFQVSAMEQTSDEILDSLYELAQEQKSSLQNLKQILAVADLVKFAKFNPLSDENQLSMVNAKMFIEQTKQVLIEDNPEEKEEGE